VSFCAPHIPQRLVWNDGLATNNLSHETVTSYSKQPSAGINLKTNTANKQQECFNEFLQNYDRAKE